VVRCGAFDYVIRVHVRKAVWCGVVHSTMSSIRAAAGLRPGGVVQCGLKFLKKMKNFLRKQKMNFYLLGKTPDPSIEKPTLF
jgi:hypothetical protein